MTSNIRRYGWKRDRPDHRDRIYVLPQHIAATSLPPSADLRAQCPPVYDQGQIGSCTANAIAGALEFEMMKQNLPVFTPSRLFIYYNERAIEGTIDTDSGAEIRNGIKSVATQGDCPEIEWPYDDSPSNPDGTFQPGDPAGQKPPQSCYDDAIKHKALSYLSMNQTLDDLKGCLATGYPFVFGFVVYQSFESDQVAQTGIVPMPSPNEQVVGGHAVVAVGYDDQKQVFICRNSWAASWGDKGYFYLPYAYLHDSNLASDFWTIRLVSAPVTPMTRLHEVSNDPDLLDLKWKDVTINIHWAAATWILGLICAGITAYGQGDTSAWSTWVGAVGIAFASWANLTKVQASNLKTGDLVQAAADLIELLQKKRLR